MIDSLRSARQINLEHRALPACRPTTHLALHRLDQRFGNCQSWPGALGQRRHDAVDCGSERHCLNCQSELTGKGQGQLLEVFNQTRQHLDFVIQRFEQRFIDLDQAILGSLDLRP